MINFIKKIIENDFFNKTSCKENKFCVLLTASINPNGCYYLKRACPIIREKDYIKSIKMWLKKTRLPIVFCENSGYDISKIIKIARKYPGRVEIIQFNGNDYPRYLGTGHGEMKIMEKAMNESGFIKKSEYIVKVTGRLFIPNIVSILNNFDQEIFIAHESIDHAQKFLGSRSFIYKKDFFTKYFYKYKELLNDEKAIHFEKILYLAFENSNNDYYKSKRIFFEYYGYGGTKNIPYGDTEISTSVRIKRKIKRILGKIGIIINKILLIYIKK